MTKIKIIAVLMLIVVCASIFGACEFTYGTPDSLDIAGSTTLDRIWIGIQVSLLGIGMVFIVLAVLILFIMLLKWFFGLLNKRNKIVKAVVNAPAPVTSVETASEEDVVAAITAALVAYYDNKNTVYKSNVKFKVRSIKEIK